MMGQYIVLVVIMEYHTRKSNEIRNLHSLYEKQDEASKLIFKNNSTVAYCDTVVSGLKE